MRSAPPSIALLEQRLAAVSTAYPGVRRRRCAATAPPQPAATAPPRTALAAWLGGQPHVAAAAKRSAGIRGDLDHFGALGFLQGLLTVLRDAGHPGLLLVLDEVETLQRVRGDVRDKALNALRQLIDEIDAGRFPACSWSSPAPRPSSTDRRACSACRRWPSGWPPTSPPTRASTIPRAVQLRLPGFDRDSLVELGAKVRDLYAHGQPIRPIGSQTVDDAYLGDWPTRSPARSAARSASRRGSS